MVQMFGAMHVRLVVLSPRSLKCFRERLPQVQECTYSWLDESARMTNPDRSFDPQEVAKFEALASEWWSANGKFRPLHMLNPCRLDYILDQICAELRRVRTEARPLRELKLVDIGCGGGLICEPMARLGADVTGVDASEASIGAATAHASQSGLDIRYLCSTAESLVERGERFDVVLALEVIEHVPDPGTFMGACAALLNPGGLMICSTINRTTRSFVMAIVGAEYVLRWLPRGTHDWRRFLKPAELDNLMVAAGLEPLDCKGLVFNPISRSWSVSFRDTGVNYVSACSRPLLI